MKKFALFFLLIFVYIFANHNIAQTINDRTNSSGKYVTGFVDIGNCQISYEMKGEGIPLIMIHGGALDKRMWDGQFDEFAKHFRVIRYDARKHGMTKSEPDTFSHHEDLNLLMDKLEIKKAVIMGLSMGGYITIDFALAYPEKVLAIIPVASGLTGYQFVDKQTKELPEKWSKISTVEEAVDLIMEMWTDGPHRKPEQLNQEMRNKVKQIYTENLLQSFNDKYTETRSDPPAINRLSEIKAPAFTIYGDLDVPGIIEIGEMIVKEVNGAKSYIIKDTAHLLNMEKPEEFNKAVIDFISSLKLN